MTTMTGGRAIVETLRAEGVSCVFGVPGEEMLEIMDATLSEPPLRFIHTRHEQGAAFMAYGYARSTGIPGVCLSTAGPGATNLLTGVAAAYKGFLPLIVLTGRPPRAFLEKDSIQEIDQVGIFKPVTKWSYEVTDAARLPETMEKAFRIALTDPQGPVHLSIPGDVPADKIEASLKKPAQYRVGNSLRCTENDVARAGKLLLDAHTPVLVAGREVIHAGCTNLVQALAEITGIPVATTVGQPDAFPNTHPFGVGPIGQWGGWDPANKLVASADLLFAIGEHFEFDMSAVRYAYGVVSPNTRIVQVNRFPGALGQVYPLELGLVSDLPWFLETLLDWLKNQPLKPRVTEAAELKRAWDQKRCGIIDPNAAPLQPEFVGQRIRQMTRPDAVISSEVGKFLRQVRPYMDTYVPNTMLYAENFACLGSALPMTLGAKLGWPDRQMVCLCGDGGFTFNASELETAVREKLSATVVIFDDQSYGSIRAIQKNRYGRVVGADFGEVDFAALARSLGAQGQTIARPAEFEQAFARALASDQMTVLDVRIKS